MPSIGTPLAKGFPTPPHLFSHLLPPTPHRLSLDPPTPLAFLSPCINIRTTPQALPVNPALIPPTHLLRLRSSPSPCSPRPLWFPCPSSASSPIPLGWEMLEDSL